jgi:hypothetical protein
MSKLNLSGSCLCGSVAYEIGGDSMHFFHCHCQRCRKATGTGHASNIIMRPDNVSWTAGEELLTRFEVPDAKRFATVFCNRCGSSMPRIAPDLSVAVVPAGTLDNDPGIGPSARIFQDSKTDWSCDASEIPAFATYPPPAN